MKRSIRKFIDRKLTASASGKGMLLAVLFLVFAFSLNYLVTLNIVQPFSSLYAATELRRPTAHSDVAGNTTGDANAYDTSMATAAVTLNQSI